MCWSINIRPACPHAGRRSPADGELDSRFCLIRQKERVIGLSFSGSSTKPAVNYAICYLARVVKRILLRCFPRGVIHASSSTNRVHAVRWTHRRGVDFRYATDCHKRGRLRILSHDGDSWSRPEAHPSTQLTATSFGHVVQMALAFFTCLSTCRSTVWLMCGCRCCCAAPRNPTANVQR